MKALRRFTVRLALPEPLAPLAELVLNLRWSWHHPSLDLFESIDPAVWAQVNHDPRAAARRGQSRAAGRARRRRRRSSTQLRRGAPRPRELPDHAEVVPVARGRAGLDRLLLARVRHHRGAPAVLRRSRHPGRRPPQGGLRPRRTDPRGRPALPGRLLQAEPQRRGLAAGALPTARPARAAAHPAAQRRRQTRSRSPCRSPRDASLHAQIWKAQVGRVPLLLLDSDVEANALEERQITDRLYGGGTGHRLAQELLLGIGGVRAIRAYTALTGDPAPEVFHTNEGHAGFLGIERIRELVGRRPVLRRGARGGPRRHGLHHAHAGPGRHRPLPARADRGRLHR